MECPTFYIWVNDKEFIEIYDCSFNFGFDDYYNISNLEIYVSEENCNDIIKMEKDSNVSVESNEFYVEQAKLNVCKIDEDLNKIILEQHGKVNGIYCLYINFNSKFMTSDDFVIVKKHLNRKRSLNSIIKIGNER
jgi:hypothetical protein